MFNGRRVVDFLQVRVVANVFDSFLQRHNFVVACHDGDRTELEALGEVHRPDRNVPRRRLVPFVEILERQSSFLAGRSSCAADRTNKPISLGATPDSSRTLIQVATALAPRPTPDWVGKVISAIGRKANVIVEPVKGEPDTPGYKAPKCASAHNFRRTFADGWYA